MNSSFNLAVVRLVLTIVFFYGSKINDLIKLRIKNYAPEKKLISFTIRPDKLLKQDTIYIPLHWPLDDLVDRMLECRNSKNPASDNDTLFCVYEKGYFKPLSKDIINNYFNTVSEKTKENVDERALYQSHVCFYNHIGRLNPVIGEVISNRLESDVYVPRLYTQVSLYHLRCEHFEAFKKVRSFLWPQTKKIPGCYEAKSEEQNLLGGKRAPGRDTIKAAFHYFMMLDLNIFRNSLSEVTFLINYLTGSRVAEIISLTIKNVDMDLNITKFRVKDTLKRKDTTKVIPIPPYLLEKLKSYLRLRSDILDAAKERDFPFLLFSLNKNRPKQLTEEKVNDFYREIAMNCRIPHFTSHCLRYQTQTDMTREGLSFVHTNCLLSHYPACDAIFSKKSEVLFTDFRENYFKIVERILREVL